MFKVDAIEDNLQEDFRASVFAYVGSALVSIPLAQLFVWLAVRFDQSQHPHSQEIYGRPGYYSILFGQWTDDFTVTFMNYFWAFLVAWCAAAAITLVVVMVRRTRKQQSLYLFEFNILLYVAVIFLLVVKAFFMLVA